VPPNLKKKYLPKARGRGGLSAKFLTNLFYQGHYLAFTLRPYPTILAEAIIYPGGRGEGAYR
jgi:hypothetical protein